ncbi:MAG: hypothetical protein IKN98_01040 [Bacteroidales bacterium]|nr:hypothetical protein [Bacteroidales bacterium]
MPVTIREQPHPFDFAGNPTRYLLKGTPIVTAGQKSKSSWRVNALPSAVLTLSYGETVFNFQITSISQARYYPDRIAAYTDPAQLQEELTSKIAENYTISRHYEVTVEDDLTVNFLSKEYGADVVYLDGNGSGDIEMLVLNYGIARTERPNYGVFAKFEITRYSSGSVQEVETPEILLHLNDSNMAVLPLEILRSYFTAADVPSLTETYDVYPLLYATIKCRLTYSDIYGIVPQVNVLKHSQEFLLSAGKLDDEHHSLNLADWGTAMGANVRLSDYTDIRDFGCPNGLTVRSYAELPQYVYFLLFNTQRDSSYSRNLTVNVSVRHKDGSTHVFNPGLLTVTNRNIVRIPVSVQALGLSADDTLSYNVFVLNGSSSAWSRTYVLGQKPYNSQVFLLQNRYGLLETFFTDTSAIDEKTEGGDTVQNGVAGTDITDTATIHTARTGYKTAREIQAIADAMRNRFNYRIVGSRIVPIAIIPDTLTVNDTAEDLISAEFQYRFNRPSTSGTIGNIPIVPGIPDVWVDRLTWLDYLRQVAPQTNDITANYKIK